MQASVSAVNDTPILARNNTLTLKAAATATITTAGYLSVTDVDNTAAQITYTVGSAPTHGSLKKSGTTLTTSDTFTQDDVDNNRITYVHGSSTDTALDSFTFTVSDGAGGSITSTTFNITPVVAPQTLTRTSPSLTPGSSTSVSVKAVGGSVSSGRVVKFYKDSSCAAGQFGSDATTDGSNEASATGSLSVDGAYSFYATVTLNSVVSDCSPGAGAANYVLDTTNPTAPTGLARLTPAGATGTSATPTLRLSGGDAGGVGITAKVYSDNTCATLAGTGSINSADVTLDTITSGAHTYYAKLFDEAGNESSCSTANVSYTLNQTPTISDTTNQTTNEDTATSAIAFTVGDAETAAGSLTVTASSSNQTVVPDANLTLGGSGASRTVTITPAANQNGTATITLTVSDGFSSVSDTFVLTVTAVNDAPTLTTISNLSTTTDTALTIQYSDLLTAANEADVDGDTISFRVEAVSTGTLTKGGTSVTAGTTLLSSGESLVWTPASGATGALNAFTVKAYDGTTASASAVQVVVDVTAVSYIDSDDSSTGFGGGSKVGVAWNTSTTNKLILAPDTNCNGNMGEGETTYTNCADLDESWTPQWSSIVGYWKMNESSWNGTADEVVNSKGSSHGTRVGDATTSSTSKIGSKAGTFDGNGDYVTIPANSNFSFGTGDFAVSFWINPTSSCFGGLSFNGGASGATYSRSAWAIQSGGTSLSFYRWDGTTETDLSLGRLPPNNDWSQVIVSRISGTLTAYINSLQIYSAANSLSLNDVDGQPLVMGFISTGGGCAAQRYLTGKLDDVAIWKGAGLTSAEVQTIYSRQSAKYSGMLTSRVFAQGSSQIWDGLKWLTTLPFGKELTGDADNSSTITSADSEAHTDYPSLVGSTGSTSDDNLMSGLKGLWHLNGTVGSIANNTSLTDSSGLGNTGTAKNSNASGMSHQALGKFAQGISFDGADDYIQVPNLDYNVLTVSAWVARGRIGTDNDRIVLSTAANGWGVFLKSNNKIGFTKVGVSEAASTATYTTLNEFHHLVVTYNGSNACFYIDGILDSCPALSATFNSSGNVYAIGGGYGGFTFQGSMDEVAIWSRALHADEVKQLYRRGANRIKFQVRTCIDAACNCRAYGASGTTNDCDGDTIANASDTSDSYKAIWRGSDGTNGTYFSELHNKDLYDSTANCGLSNLVLPGSPNLLFNCFSPSLSSSVLTNRYFQYRTILESDDATTNCNYGSGATWCSPELRSVEVLP